MVKNLLATQEMLVQSLGREDSMEKEMATCSGTLARRISWSEEPGGTVHRASKSQTQLRNGTCMHAFVH